MNQYVNFFSCAKDNSGVEIVINAKQTFPVFDENGTITGTQREDVASLVMTTEIARIFSQELSDILNEIDTKSDPKVISKSEPTEIPE